MSRYLYKKIQNISPESLNFQHSGLKLTTLGSDPGIPIHPVKCPSVHSNLPVALPDSLLSVLLFRLFGRVLDRTGVWSVFVFSIVVTTSPSSLNL